MQLDGTEIENSELL